MDVLCLFQTGTVRKLPSPPWKEALWLQSFTVGIPSTLSSGGLPLPPGRVFLAKPECYEPPDTILVLWPKQIPFLQLCQHLLQGLDQHTSPPCSLLGALQVHDRTTQHAPGPACSDFVFLSRRQVELSGVLSVLKGGS